MESPSTSTLLLGWLSSLRGEGARLASTERSLDERGDENGLKNVSKLPPRWPPPPGPNWNCPRTGRLIIARQQAAATPCLTLNRAPLPSRWKNWPFAAIELRPMDGPPTPRSRAAAATIGR